MRILETTSAVRTAFDNWTNHELEFLVPIPVLSVLLDVKGLGKDIKTDLGTYRSASHWLIV